MQRKLKSGLLAILGASAIIGSTLCAINCKKSDTETKKETTQICQNVWDLSDGKIKSNKVEKLEEIAYTNDSKLVYCRNGFSETKIFENEGVIGGRFETKREITQPTKISAGFATAVVIMNVPIKYLEKLKSNYTGYLISTETLTFDRTEIEDVTNKINKGKKKYFENIFHEEKKPDRIKKEYRIYKVCEGEGIWDSEFKSKAKTERIIIDYANDKQIVPDLGIRAIIEFEISKEDKSERVTLVTYPLGNLTPVIPQIKGVWETEDKKYKVGINDIQVIKKEEQDIKIWGSQQLTLVKDILYLEGTTTGPYIKMSFKKEKPSLKYYPEKNSKEKAQELNFVSTIN